METIEKVSLPVSDARGVPDAVAVNDTKVAYDPRSQKAIRTEYIHYATMCASLFLAGWNDGTTGPLLPRIQEVYHVKYAVVSIIFIASCVGFISGAIANVWLDRRIGFGKLIAFGAAVQVVGYAIMAPAPPFPVLVLGYFLNGFGLSFQDAQANGYVASLKYHAETKMGILHAVYGLGALVAPLVSTQFASAKRWSFHYLTSLGIAGFTLIVLIVMFRGRRLSDCLADIEQMPTEHDIARDAGHTEGNEFKRVMRLRAVHLLAFYILIYVGVEVTLGGWMVTFIIEARGGGASSGYISSGFFGGLTLGRVVLLPFNRLIGERRVVYLYSIIAIALDIVIWRVRHLVGNGVAVAIIGFVLGPMYPIAMNQASRVIPPSLLTGSIGWIAGFGQAGGALLPFITGALAGSAGITSLQPFLLAMMVVMVALWALTPTQPPTMTPTDTLEEREIEDTKVEV